MNSYTLADITIGKSESFTVCITEEKMKLFHAMSGDCSPIHMNDEYAKARGFSSRVCFGMLGASMFSTLAGVYLPGENCLLHSVEAKFAKPIFIGDTLTVAGVVSEINETFNEITIKATLTNQNNVKVTRGIIKAGVAK